MGELILVRHGETDWSRHGRHTSWTDLPLSDRGRDQARGLAPWFATRAAPALVLVSPMARAEDTARLAGLTDAHVEPDLHEWDYGGYEGVTTAQITAGRPGWFLFSDGVPPGPAGHPGEDAEQVGVRADRVLARAQAALAADAGDVVLVAHAHVLRVLTARRLGLPAAAGAAFHLETATVSRLGLEHGRPVLTAWNSEPAPDRQPAGALG